MCEELSGHCTARVAAEGPLGFPLLSHSFGPRSLPPALGPAPSTCASRSYLSCWQSVINNSSLIIVVVIPFVLILTFALRANAELPAQAPGSCRTDSSIAGQVGSLLLAGR